MVLASKGKNLANFEVRWKQNKINSQRLSSTPKKGITHPDGTNSYFRKTPRAMVMRPWDLVRSLKDQWKSALLKTKLEIRMRFRMLLESKGDTSSKVINSCRITPKVDECIKKRLIMKKDPLCGGSFFVLIFCCLWTTTQSSSNIYDRFCVRNFGCDTDFQDMALGVSQFNICIYNSGQRLFI